MTRGEVGPGLPPAGSAAEAATLRIVMLALLPELQKNILSDLFRHAGVVQNAPGHAIDQVDVAFMEHQQGVAITGAMRSSRMPSSGWFSPFGPLYPASIYCNHIIRL